MLNPITYFQDVRKYQKELKALEGYDAINRKHNIALGKLFAVALFLVVVVEIVVLQIF